MAHQQLSVFSQPFHFPMSPPKTKSLQSLIEDIDRSRTTHIIEEPPTTTVRFPDDSVLHGWVQLGDNPIYQPILIRGPGDAVIEKGKTWCSLCLTTFDGKVGTNIHHHLKTKAHLSRADPESRSSSMTMHEMSNRIVHFFLEEAIAFRKIESQLLRAVCPILPSRKELSNLAATYAGRVRSAVKNTLMLGEQLSLSADEWTSQCGDRYLGICATALIDSSYRHFVLAMTPLIEYVHACLCTDDQAHHTGSHRKLCTLS